MYLGFRSVIEAKFWGILDGVTLLLEWKYDSMIIQIDNTEIVVAIQNEAHNELDSTLIKRIHQNLSKVRHWGIQHIPKEHNGEPDGITRHVKDRRKVIQIFEVSPLGI